MKERRGEARAEIKVSGKSRIVLVDDHPIVRQGLAQLLNREKDLVVCADAGDESSGWQAVLTHKPDIVIVDLSLKEGSGLDLIRRIRDEFRETAILVLSMHDETYYVERALRAGAWGYLTKQEASDKVLTAIRKLLAGEVYLGIPFSPVLLKSLLTGRQGSEDSLIECLSERELQVFEMIGSGMGAQEIADALHLSIKTIATYQAHIKEKLALRDSRKLVQYAIRWALNRETRES